MKNIKSKRITDNENVDCSYYHLEQLDEDYDEYCYLGFDINDCHKCRFNKLNNPNGFAKTKAGGQKNI